MSGKSLGLVLIELFAIAMPFITLAVAYAIWRIGINTFEISQTLKEINKKLDSNRK